MGCVINAEIDLRVGKAEHLFRLGRRPTQHRFDPRPQLSRAERLRNVVIGAEFESEDLFGPHEISPSAEGRSNYEARDTGSIWAGINFSGGDALS